MDDLLGEYFSFFDEYNYCVMLYSCFTEYTISALATELWLFLVSPIENLLHTLVKNT